MALELAEIELMTEEIRGAADEMMPLILALLTGAAEEEAMVLLDKFDEDAALLIDVIDVGETLLVAVIDDDPFAVGATELILLFEIEFEEALEFTGSVKDFIVEALAELIEALKDATSAETEALTVAILELKADLSIVAVASTDLIIELMEDIFVLVAFDGLVEAIELVGYAAEVPDIFVAAAATEAFEKAIDTSDLIELTADATEGIAEIELTTDLASDLIELKVAIAPDLSETAPDGVLVTFNVLCDLVEDG